MRTLHQKLHLQHHRHTGKLLHHSHTSYRSIFVVLVLAVACMGGLAYVQRVAADDVMSVSFSVHVPVPHTPAIISKPESGTTLPSGDTMIVGTCPIVAPQPVIVIAVDGKTAGSAACNAVSEFSFSTHLIAGAHDITATPYTVDNDHGPTSPPVHITSQGITPEVAQVGTLTPTSTFATLDGNKVVDWYGTLTGAKPSYTLLLEWGDGTYDSYKVSAGPQHLTHRYATFASYTVTLGLRDETGRYQYQQFAAAATDPTTIAALGSTDFNQPTPTSGTIIGLYGLFVTLVCVTAIARLHAAPFAYAPIRIGHHAKS